MDFNTIQTEVREYIVDLSGNDSVEPDWVLLETGVIASLQLLDLINFVADTFGVEVNERDVYDGKFASITSIAQFVAAQRGVDQTAPLAQSV